MLSKSASANSANMSGRCVSNAAWMLLKDHTKIPLFQQNSPDSKKVWAVAKSGFSVNVFTGLTSWRWASCGSSYWIYPYPVSGLVGWMPRVTRDVVLRVVSNAVRQTSKNLFWTSKKIFGRPKVFCTSKKFFGRPKDFLDVQKFFWTSNKFFGRPKVFWTSKAFLDVQEFLDVQKSFLDVQGFDVNDWGLTGKGGHCAY